MAVGLTYTRGRDLDRRQSQRQSIGLGQRLLLLTSCVTLLGITLAYQGRMRAEAWTTGPAAAPVNLNSIGDAPALEAPLATVFAYPADRRFAAEQIAAALFDGSDRRQVPNVGALARIAVPVDAIDGRRGLVAFADRLQAARRAAAAAGRELPQTLTLLTAAELAALKPALSVRTPAEFRSAVLWCALALIAAFHAVSLVWRWRGVTGDRLLLAVAHLLVGIGFLLILTRPDPLRDTLLLVRFTEGVVVGLAIFAAVTLIDLDAAPIRELSYVPLIAALGLSVVLLLFGSGPGTSGAKVNLGPVQPIEGIRLLLGLFLAGYFARKWELIRALRTETIRTRRLPDWLNVPRLDDVLPVAIGVAAALVLFFLQKDLGPALLLSLMFLAMFVVARGGAVLAGAGLMVLAAGLAIGELLRISSTLSARLAMWQSPWDNAVRGGDQVAQAIWALAAGAFGGTGAGLGHTRFLPEGHTDLALAAVGEELGFVGLLVVGVAFALVASRGVQIARRASSDYRFFLALAMTLSLTIPVLVMAAGVLGVLPLTGVVTPFLSYGGSAMAANFAALGLLVAIDRDRPAVADLAPFQAPLRWIGRAATVSAGALLAIAGTTQILRADEYLVRPQLGLQADGGRRFQVNPRVLDALRSIPRGTIFDRTGLPLATDDAGVVRAAAKELARLGIRVDDVCPSAGRRCYPAGAPLFHVVGDANTKLNWSAANTSYVERDEEARLRGFDDRAANVPTADRDGRPSFAVRRDYADLVPIVRHRYQPGHPDVKAVIDRSRDVRLTIDARLQLAVASILERAVRPPAGGKGAVVVIDAATGQVLASVSYPFPSAGGNGVASGASGAGTATVPAEALLDRARYGLYPPGSTFKIVTAAAALRDNPALGRQTFTCQRLPSGRVGASIRGWGSIHDDLLDPHPHGRLEMRDAIVRSCNAYFANLAVALGSESLARTAAVAGIALNTSRDADRVHANLPHAGYGQGEVVVTPLRLARVAAAIGTDGTLREAAIVRGDAPAIETPFVSASAARTLGSALRQAVVSGTGRLLSRHPARIAGKTGTAEVDEAASHAWFAGFAPHGAASRRIAFAVVLEHAGYGGASAASVAGQVATAAASLGLAK